MALRNELVQTLMERVDTRSEDTVRTGVIVLWHRLMGKFSPLIGPSSVQVLFMRSLDANRTLFPWLPSVRGDDSEAGLFSTFEAVLMTQSSDEVLKATRALLGSFVDALFTLIGTTLTGQFVCSVFRIDSTQRK